MATNILAILITACTSARNQTLKNETELSVTEKIVKGETTATEVKAMFGSSMSGTRKALVILFDENDVVKRANMSESKIETETGVFQ